MMYRDFLYVAPKEYFDPVVGVWREWPRNLYLGDKDYLAQYYEIENNYKILKNSQSVYKDEIVYEITLCGNVIKFNIDKGPKNCRKHITLRLVMNQFVESAESPIVYHDISLRLSENPKHWEIGLRDVAEPLIAFKFDADEYNKIICKELREEITKMVFDDAFYNDIQLQKIPEVTEFLKFLKEIGDSQAVLKDLLDEVASKKIFL